MTPPAQETPEAIAEPNSHAAMLRQWAQWVREPQEQIGDPHQWCDIGDVDWEALLEAADEIDRLEAERTAAAAQVAAARATALEEGERRGIERAAEYHDALAATAVKGSAHSRQKGWHRHHAAAIRALGPAPSTAGAWRDMASAPKGPLDDGDNGPDVLCWAAGRRVILHWWLEGWWNDELVQFEPSGWQPLPAPPVTAP